MAGSFMNINLIFNVSILLIAIQISAYKNEKDISLAFTKVWDRIALGDYDETYEVTDRNYWENKLTLRILKWFMRCIKNLMNLLSVMS